jgi:predicted dehydrogenase
VNNIEHKPVDRRKFLRAGTAAAAGVLSLPAASYTCVPGANERLRVGFLGCGARAQAHIHLVNKLALETRDVQAVAVCDVWDGHEDEYLQPHPTGSVRRKYSQGLYPSAKKCGLEPNDRVHVVKDYRRVLELKEVDVVCITTPDHWHARMTLDAFAAGKDVYCEKPMTRTAAEALAVLEAQTRHNRVMTIGMQTLADPVWHAANAAIRSVLIGEVAHLSAGVFKHDPRGMWRFYRTTASMTPKTIDWDLFLGHGFEVDGEKLGPTATEQPFTPASFAQWRCEAAFSDGIFSDGFMTPLTQLLTASGLRNPSRVMAAGGLFHERDGRTVPDVGTLAVDFDRAQMVITGTTVNCYPQETLIRGTKATMKFIKGGYQIIGEKTTDSFAIEPPKNETELLWRDFLNCVRNRSRQTVSPPEVNSMASTITAMARQSLGRVA